MAVDEKFILEAVKKNDSPNDSRPQVRVVPLSDFLQGKSQVKHFIRPQSLSESQLARLNIFANSNFHKNYTKLHAGFTITIPTMKWLLIFLAFFSIIYTWQKNGVTNSSLSAGLIIIGIIGLAYFSLAWACRCEWGAKTTERLFRKFGWSNWLVERKYEWFCSKLVLLADKEIGGQIYLHAPSEHEVQPRHIVLACEKLDWKSVYMQDNNKKKSDGI